MERKLDRVGSVTLVMTGALVGIRGCYILPIRFKEEWNVRSSFLKGGGGREIIMINKGATFNNEH